jgi:transposase
MLLASSRGEYAPKIAESLGCGEQTVRDAIHDFNERGLDALVARSSRPKRTRDAFEEESAEALREMLHRSPREFGYDTSLWTLEMAAEVAFEEGLTQRRVSGETIRTTQAVDHLPRPPVRKKKRRRDRLMEIAAADPDAWAVGFLDECWWSRVALPTLSSWTEEGKPLRLVQRSVATNDPEPKLRRPSPATDSTCHGSAIRGCASLTEGPSVP